MNFAYYKIMFAKTIFWSLLIMIGVANLYSEERAMWTTNGIPVCTATGEQNYPSVVSDGFGGVIIVWWDFRNGNDYDIYAQRIDSNGNIKWQTDGVVICTATSEQSYLAVITDGNGGAIITWQDLRNGNYDIYAQRIDSNGNVKWGTNGVVICTDTTNNQVYPVLATDGANGAIIAWMDLRWNTYDIYAQRVDLNGNVKWSKNGVAVGAGSNDQSNPSIVSDGAGGAFISWDDNRNGGSNYDIYAQRMNSSGASQWTLYGIAVCSDANSQKFPKMVSDGSGGAIITWQDNRSVANGLDIYAQRLNSSGTSQWAINGICVCGAVGDQNYPVIITDGASGAIISWMDKRASNSYIYAQHISSGGDAKWVSNGVCVCSAIGEHTYPLIVSDAFGGAVFTWRDTRNSADDIYIQWLKSDSTLQGNVDGVAVCTYSNAQTYPAILSNNLGVSIVAWQDNRNGSDNDIYVQKMFIMGNNTNPTDLTLVKVFPNPYRPSYNAGVNFINLTLDSKVNIFNIVGEKINEIMPDASGIAIWDGKNSYGELVASGVYLGYVSDGTNRKIIKIAVER